MPNRVLAQILRGCLFAIGLFGMTGSRARAADGQATNRDLRGIDLVVLVDVSASMSRNPGSDTDRIRWDAVKLSLDLMGHADRVMIQRFNDECPAGFKDAADDPAGYEKLLKDRWFPDQKMGFQRKLQRLTDRNRSDISRKIAAFNRTDDDIPGTGDGYLDYGNTSIVGALASITDQIQQSSAVRTKQVILLTDGLDTDYEHGKYREEAELRETLAVFVADSSGPGKVPIHIVGLNLQGEGEEDARLARELLTRIAHLSGGQFFEVRDSANLVAAFVKLIREIKGYWVDTVQYDPRTDGSVRLAKSLVVSGIIDLGILSYDKLTKAQYESPKYKIRPPQQPVELNWVSLHPHTVKQMQPEVRTGNSETLYRYSYFGPELSDDSSLGRSPFAGPDFEKPVTLNLTMRGQETEQHLIMLKGAVDLFALRIPAAGDTFHRNQTLTILVEMAPSDHFVPGQFKVVARVKPVGTGDTVDRPSETDDAEVVTLRPFSNPNGTRGFETPLRLSRLPRGDGDRDSYQVAVSIEGLGTPEHALSGNHRDLPPRVFTVENSLTIRPLEDVELTHSEHSAEIDVGTAFPVEEDIELNVEFMPPASKNGTVSEDSLRTTYSDGTTGEGRLVLKQGKGTIRFSLNNNLLPERGIVYRPGRIRITHPGDLRMAPQEAHVGLRLDLGRVEVKPAYQLIEAGDMEIGSEPVRVWLDPPNQSGFDDETVTVTLFPLPAPGSSIDDEPAPSSPAAGIRRDVPMAGQQKPRSDSTAKTELRTFNPKTTFGVQELWLARVTENPLSPSQHGHSLTGLNLNEELRVHLHARGTKKSGKYPFLLRASGDWMVPAEARFDISVNAPRVELDSKVQTMYVVPGRSGQVVFRAWLSSALEGGSRPVHVRDAFTAQKVTFASSTPGAPVEMFEVSCPHKEQPVVLLPGEDSARLVPFTLHVPAGTPYGRYSASFELVGPDVIPQTLITNVVVNSLKFDIATTDPETRKTVWRPATSDEVVQLADLPMTQCLRLRTGLGEPFADVEQVAIERAGPFQDEAGDVQPLPAVHKELSKDCLSLRLKLRFSEVPNFSSRGDPYTIAIVATARDLHVPDEKFTFRVRFLLVRDVLRSTPSSTDKVQTNE